MVVTLTKNLKMRRTLMTTVFHRQFFIQAILFCLTILTASGQDLTTDIKNNAIKITRTDSLDNSIYKLLADYQLIMIGEMHGGNEPAKFVVGLTKLLTDNGDSVQVGLEIPSEQMSKFLTDKTDSSIYLSEFFTKEPLYGIESFAWAEILSTLNKNKKAKLFFFDTNKKDYETSKNRDSLMYFKVKKQIQSNPNWKTITLSGNIHNMIQPFRGTNTMAYYLKIDKELNLQDKICSLNHRCKSGTRINNSGNGLELKQVRSPDSDFSTAVDYDSYLFLFTKNTTDNYNGIYFTRLVTAAKMVGSK